jgi:hypothetical protein
MLSSGKADFKAPAHVAFMSRGAKWIKSNQSEINGSQTRQSATWKPPEEMARFDKR